MANEKTPKFTREEAAKKTMAGDSSLSQFIMAWSYLPDEQMTVLSDGSVMKVFECYAAPTSTMSDGALKAMSDAIASSMSRLPANTIIQSIVAPTIDIDDDLASYRKMGSGTHPLFAAVEAKKIEHFLETRRKPMFSWRSVGGSYMTRRFRILLTVIVVPDEVAGGVKASFMDSLSSLGDQFKSFFGGKKHIRVDRSATEERFEQLRSKLMEQLDTATSSLVMVLNGRGVSVKPIAINSYIAAMRGLIYPISGGERIEWDPEQPLAHQIPISDLTVDFAEGHIKADGVYHRCASLAGLPKSSYPGFLSRPQAMFNGLTVLDYLTQGFIAFSGIVMDRKEVRNYLEKRGRFINGGFAVKERKPFLLADIDMMNQKVEGEGRNVFVGQIVMASWDHDPSASKQRMDRLREKLEQIDLKFRSEIHHGPSLWLQSLPGNYAPSLPESRRLHWMADDAVADFLPVYGMGRGTIRARFMAHNRMGEPTRIDLFDGAAPHGIVVGASGSGKSFFVNNFVADFLRAPNTQAFFIDKGRSYETLTSLCGDDGQHSVFGLKSRTCINPCAGTINQASSFLKAFIAYLVVQSKERDSLSADQVGMISKAINSAFQRKQIPGLPYTGGYSDAVRAHPGVYFQRMSKRFVIERLERGGLSALERARNADVGRTPEFTVYYIAQVSGKGRQAGWSRSSDVPEDVQEWFTARQAEIDDSIPGTNGISILYRQDSLEAAMQREEFHFQPNPAIMVLECQREEDLEIAQGAGVEVKYPDEFMADMRKRVTDEIAANPSYANATKAAIDDYIKMRLSEIPAKDYFRWATGSITTQSEVFLSDIERELSGYGHELAASVASRMSPYVGTGIHAGFFDGKTEFSIAGKRIVCWEIEELASGGPHILGAVVGSLLQMMILYGQSDEGRMIQKILILEEFWQLLEVDMIAEQVINLYRTARKFNTGVLCISQLISDFSDSKNGRRVMDQATFRFILLQPSNVVAETDKTLKFSEEHTALLSTVTSQRGLFSEILYQRTDNNDCDVMRLVPNPFFYWVASTHPGEAKLRERRIKEISMEVKDRRDATRLALEQLSREYPNGIENGKKG